MKRFLRSCFTLALFGSFFISYAQGGPGPDDCNVSNVIIQNIRITDASSNDNKCTATFDVSFSINVNNGNKYIYIQTYIASAIRNGQTVANPNPYPNYFNCQNGATNQRRAPQKAEAGSPLLNIAIDNTGATPVFTNYKPDVSLDTNGALQSSTIQVTQLSSGNMYYTITGLEVVLPYECSTNSQYNFVTDVFATNAASPAAPLSCVSCGIATPLANVTITGGSTDCNVVSATLRNNTNRAIQGTYSLYADVNRNRVFSPATVGGADQIITTQTITIGANATATINYSLTGSFLDNDVFVVVNAGAVQLAQLLPTTGCAPLPPLPVTLQSFSAKRNKDRVVLNWETASESNNKGFYVQRNLGQGWANITFVATKANGGNSNSVLAYAYSDINNEKGVTQYRLLQTDYDGKSKVSEVRTVRGEAQVSKTMIYPNPSNDGSINILFDENRGSKDVFISDMNGRIIKQYRNVTTTNMRIDHLIPGLYTVRIVAQADGSQTNEKVVINK